MGEPGVGKPRLTRITAMLFSGYHGGDGNFRTAEDFDVFRGLQFNSTPALYDDGDVSLEPIKKNAFSDVSNNKGILKERWTAAKSSKATPHYHRQLVCRPGGCKPRGHIHLS